MERFINLWPICLFKFYIVKYIVKLEQANRPHTWTTS